MNNYYVYAASSPFYINDDKIKLGHTGHPHKRISTYLTGCPPDEKKEYDISFYRIWLTDAKDEIESKRYESILHNKFIRYRMMRRIPKDTEWFHFIDADPLSSLDQFMDSQSWATRAELLNINDNPSRFLRKQMCVNTDFIFKDEKRLAILNAIQEPIIDQISCFLQEEERIAGYVTAPCGSGKTVMPSKAINDSHLERILICCPSEIIQKHWAGAMTKFSHFQKEDILFIGDSGTTDISEIERFMMKPKILLISTYMSSHLLIKSNLNRIQLFIGDEAHHQAGVIWFPNDDENGVGLTRKLLQKLSEEKIKRLFLTFTPRLVKSKDERVKCFSMDDNVVFGDEIAKLDLRYLIQKGVLPDYHIWALREESYQNTGLQGKAKCLIEAWNATEMEDGKEQFILHHLIVFTSTIKEAIELQSLLGTNLPETLVLRTQEGDLSQLIERFSSSVRAILIDCQRLSEGVDIPVANAVAILYPKQSKEQITQMLLRPGRWHENKPIFHILIPVVDDEDHSGLQEVLLALAENDECIRDELQKKFHSPSYSVKTKFQKNNFLEQNEPGRIAIEEFGSDQVRECFSSINRKVFEKKTEKERYEVLQQFNKELGITSRTLYEKSRETHPHFTENPEKYFYKYWTNWYDFLSVDCSKFPQTKEEWKKVVKERGISSLQEYNSQAGTDLPAEPNLFYPNFLNFDSELGIDEVFYNI